MNKLITIKEKLKKINIIKIVILTALLGAYGGQGHKKYRRIYIPLLLAILALLTLRNWWTLTIISMMGTFTIGYGIPCPDDPDPSSLGKFWYKIFGGNNFWSNFSTRGTIGSLIGLSLISIPVLRGNWVVYLIGCLFIIIIDGLFGWRDLGVVKIEENKYLLWSDLIVYGIIGLVTAILIYL